MLHVCYMILKKKYLGNYINIYMDVINSAREGLWLLAKKYANKIDVTH